MPSTATVKVEACVRAFILQVLCGNAVLKGAFVSFLTGLVTQLDAEITLLTAQLGRLNIVNKVLSLEISAVQAITNKVQSDLNLLLGPLAAGNSCPGLFNINTQIQSNAFGKFFVGLQNKIYQLNRRNAFIQAQNSIIMQKQKLRDDAQNFIDAIAALCS